MHIKKLLLETNEYGYWKNPPYLPPNSKLEVTISILEATTPIAKRKPAPEIIGKGKI